MAVEPTSSSPSDFAGRRERALGCPGDARGGVEAEPFGARHQPRGAELDPQRREHRVARHREGGFQRPAAFLAVGVAQLDPVEGRIGGVGEHRVGARQVRHQHAGDGHHLEGRPGGLEAFETDPGDGQDLPRGTHQDHPSVLGPERGHGVPLQRRGDARAHRRRGMRLDRGQHPAPRQQLTPGRSPQAGVEGELQAAEADGPLWGYAHRFQFGAPPGGHGADRPQRRGGRLADRRHARAGFFAAGAGRRFGQHAAVVGQQRRPPGQVGGARSCSPGRSPETPPSVPTPPRGCLRGLTMRRR